MGCSDSKAVSDADQTHPKSGEPSRAKKTPRGDSMATSFKTNVLEHAGDVRDYYTFDKVLGKGNFGVVHLVFDKNDKSKPPSACKSISKRKLVTPEDVEDVRREVQILQHLSGHKNVVQLYGTYEDKSYVHLVMECCAGGELFDRIAERGHFTEKAAAEVMRTIVSVVHHCHTMNVIHRDLKPENFLLSSKADDAILKATDFGLSRFFKDGEKLEEIVGSPFYVAPDVLSRCYSKEADIWSCGVILYILLCGWPPFHGDGTQQIFKHIMSQALDLKSDPWPRISDAAKDCVRRMLTRDPRKRLTAAQLLRHPWMKVNGVATDNMMTPEFLIRLRQFGGMNTLKKEALKVIAGHLPNQEIQGMREMFKAIDEDGSGCITVDELKEALKKKGAELAFNEVNKILDSIDINGDQKIDYEEFIAATMHLNKLNREDLMIKAFKFFDKDDSGFITEDELLASLKEVGAEDINLDVILKQADTNGDGSIDYEEFCAMMRDNEFDALVQAKTALKTRIVFRPTKSVTASKSDTPEDDFDERFAPSAKSVAVLTRPS